METLINALYAISGISFFLFAILLLAAAIASYTSGLRSHPFRIGLTVTIILFLGGIVPLIIIYNLL